MLIVTNLYCNYRCSYCIQQKSSLDVRKNTGKVDVDALLTFLRRNRVTRSASVMGGEATLHPDFEKLMDGLAKLYRKIVVTTNLNGAWYDDFPKVLETMKRWGRRVKWNTTYHPGWMDADIYIERVRSLRGAGLKVGQAATPDTPELAPETAKKLNAANIGWKLQPFTGRDDTGRMRPQTWDDINRDYPMEYDPSKYIDNYGEYIRECEDASHAENHKRERLVKCITPRFLIGPDDMVYPCHRHLYMQDGEYACGSIRDATKNDFKFKWSRIFRRWTLACGTKCNPCDFHEVKLKPLDVEGA